MQRVRLTVLVLALTGLGFTGTARAATQLPLFLAMEAMNKTIETCAAKGFKVAVAVLDPDGVTKIEARGDGSPIHSQRFAYRKAYTIMSMGPVFGVTTSGDLVSKINTVNPVGLATISAGSTELLFLPGGVLLTSHGSPIAAIGVSGAPQSAQDEACARGGRDAIQMKLNALSKTPAE